MSKPKMKFFIQYCDDGSPMLKSFGTEKEVMDFAFNFLWDLHGDGSGSWIDYIFEGRIIKDHGELK